MVKLIPVKIKVGELILDMGYDENDDSLDIPFELIEHLKEGEADDNN